MTSAATPCGQISEVQGETEDYKKCGPSHRLRTHDESISNSLQPNPN